MRLGIGISFVSVEVAIQARRRDPPSSTDLDSRGELPGAAQPIEGVGMHADAASGFRDREQIDNFTTSRIGEARRGVPVRLPRGSDLLRGGGVHIDHDERQGS